MTLHLSRLLTQRAGLTPDREAYVSGDQRFTFAQFEQRTHRLAEYLRDNGVQAKDRVAVCAKNGEFICTALFAAAHLGATLVVLNWRLSEAELDYALADSTPKALLSEAAFGATLAPIAARHPEWLLIGSGEGAVGASYDDIQQTAAAETVTWASAADAPAVIMYTSGTTGRPKGAMLGHDALINTAISTTATLDWNCDYRFLLVAPLFHIGGLSPLICNMLRGCTCVLAADFDPVGIWEVIQRERINMMMTVPLMLQAMFQVARSREVDASSLAWVICGASMVPPELIEAGAALGVAVQQVYGITECCGALTFWTQHMGMAHRDSHGRAILNSEVKIVDPNTQQNLSSGQEGEIWFRGPMLFSGYWNNPDATSAVLVDGWYRTGDIGRLDEEGFLHVIDRLKDMIISGGENIYPAEIEAVLGHLDGIAELAVVGQPDERYGEVPVAFIVRKEGSALSEADVIKACRDSLAGYKCVKRVQWMTALPRNSVGKVLKRELQEARG